MLDIKFEDFRKLKYKGTGEFHEGLALAVDHENKYGFINKAGKETIPCQFHGALDFSEGLAPVRNESGLWGYINYEGELVIPYQYEQAYNFKNGLAVVVDDHDNWGYMNKEGKEVIPCTFLQARFFENGYGIVQDEKFMFHYIDEEGNLSEPYEECLNFEDSVAVVKQNGVYYIIGTDFQIKTELPKTMKKVYHASCGMRVFQNGSGKFGYMDQEGNLKTPIYESMRPFHDEISITSLLEVRKFLYKDGSVLPISKEQYDGIDDFHEGLARTWKGKKYGYINQTGRELRPCQYKEADHFSEGLAGVMTEEGSISYIDRRGITKITIPDLHCSRLTYRENTIILRASTERELRLMKAQIIMKIREEEYTKGNTQQGQKRPQFVLKKNQ